MGTNNKLLQINHLIKSISLWWVTRYLSKWSYLVTHHELILFIWQVKSYNGMVNTYMGTDNKLQQIKTQIIYLIKNISLWWVTRYLSKWSFPDMILILTWRTERRWAAAAQSLFGPWCNHSVLSKKADETIIVSF